MYNIDQLVIENCPSLQALATRVPLARPCDIRGAKALQHLVIMAPKSHPFNQREGKEIRLALQVDPGLVSLRTLRLDIDCEQTHWGELASHPRDVAQEKSSEELRVAQLKKNARLSSFAADQVVLRSLLARNTELVRCSLVRIRRDVFEGWDLAQAVAGLPNLVELELGETCIGALAEFSLAHPRIEILKLCRAHTATVAGLNENALARLTLQCPALSQLHVDARCMKSFDVVGAVDCLKHVTIGACSLSDSWLSGVLSRATNLRTFTGSSLFFREPVIAQPQLRALGLKKCTKLKQVSLSCRKLKSLDMSDCRILRGVIMDAATSSRKATLATTFVRCPKYDKAWTPATDAAAEVAAGADTTMAGEDW